MIPTSPLTQESAYKCAQQIFDHRALIPRLSTGSPRLDKLVGGIEANHFYLFFSEANEKITDTLLYKLMVEALKESPSQVIYVLCGNYRRDRTTFDSQEFLNLLETSELEIEESLRRIQIICVFSEAQFLNLPSLVSKVINEKGDIRLIAVQQISKLFFSEKAIGFEEKSEFSGVVSKLKELCSRYKIPLVGSCRSKKKRGAVPEPMGGSFMRHSANVIVFLRVLKRGISAQLIKHFDKKRTGKRISLTGGEEEELGRITKNSMRGRIQNSMRLLRGGYRDALKDDDLQKAFDKIWETWNLEQGAMIYAQVVSALDLLNLTGVISNRRDIQILLQRLEALEKKYAA
jgi:hypothetical protein